MSSSRIAVALHGIEPAEFERCALIRDWLDDHGVDRVTLLVIPARDLHPVGERAPEMVDWLLERRRAGDSIAQHGFQHVYGARGERRLRRSGEFVGLGLEETRAAVGAGWRLMKLAGIEPDGFVAPAYAYTAALRQTLTPRFRWWASFTRVHAIGTTAGPRPELSPAWTLVGRGRLSRVASPALVRVGAMLPARTLRLDLHPADLRHARHMLALERVLERAHERRPITYAELAGLETSAAAGAQPVALNSAAGSDLTPEAAA
jgi:predicted deacetylase